MSLPEALQRPVSSLVGTMYRCTRVKRLREMMPRHPPPCQSPANHFFLCVIDGVSISPIHQLLKPRSILHLTVGDPFASVVGVKLGSGNRLLPGGKSLAVRNEAYVHTLQRQPFGCHGWTMFSQDSYFGGETRRGVLSKRLRSISL